MKHHKVSRRNVLKGAGALLAGSAFSTHVMASAPPPIAIAVMPTAMDLVSLRANIH